MAETLAETGAAGAAMLPLTVAATAAAAATTGMSEASGAPWLGIMQVGCYSLAAVRRQQQTVQVAQQVAASTQLQQKPQQESQPQRQAQLQPQQIAHR